MTELTLPRFSPAASPATRALAAIATGGFLAGTFDLGQACLLFGADIPLSIAAGLVGPRALEGGAPAYALGILLHYFIAFGAAAVYWAASRRLRFLAEHPLLCGLTFGAYVDLFMRLVVLPLSAFHAHGPYSYADLAQGIAIHMLTVGLPIAYGVRRIAG